MIFIVVKFKVLAQHSDSWLNQLTEFTTATRSEPGNLWFEWSIAAHSQTHKQDRNMFNPITFATASKQCAHC